MGKRHQNPELTAYRETRPPGLEDIDQYLEGGSYWADILLGLRESHVVRLGAPNYTALRACCRLATRSKSRRLDIGRTVLDSSTVTYGCDVDESRISCHDSI